MYHSLSLSLAFLAIFFCLSVCWLCPTAFVCALTPLLCTVQVIYKKFNVPCPFVDFAFNATASGLNVSATDPGGEDDPACIPKMANLNSQVGLRMSLSMKLQIHLHCHGHWQTPTYVIVIFSMLPVTVHDPSMEITLSLKHSEHSRGDRDFYQAVNDRQ